MTINLTDNGANVLRDGRIVFSGTISQCRDFLDAQN
jgi:hypothetical protein